MLVSADDYGNRVLCSPIASPEPSPKRNQYYDRNQATKPNKITYTIFAQPCVLVIPEEPLGEELGCAVPEGVTRGGAVVWPPPPPKNVLVVVPAADPLLEDVVLLMEPDFDTELPVPGVDTAAPPPPPVGI
jgi:hypothetical protein